MLPLDRHRRFVLYGATLIVALFACPAFAREKTDRPVFVTRAKERHRVTFYATNRLNLPVTLTLEVSDLVNLRSSAPLPYTTTLAPRSTVRLLDLSAEERGKRWRYGAWRSPWKYGSATARHDDSVVYRLPWKDGARYRVSQGYAAGRTHKGTGAYALDFDMPVGTPVVAARDGVVVAIREDSDMAGTDPSLASESNHILILHGDGTLAEYEHLRYRGVRVRPGQTVKAGTVIGLSGDTGFSSGPHLHFGVYRPLSGRERQTIPVRFYTATEWNIGLEEGREYVAGAPTRRPPP